MKAQIPWLRVFVEDVVIVGFLGPAHGSGQESLSVSCADLYSRSPLENLARCAEQGHAGAQSLLGLKYARGAGVPEDDAEGVRWYRLAAEQGNAEGQWLLGSMYGNGDGVPEDDVLAYMWFDLSGAQGHVSAQESEDIIEQRMTREQITEAQPPCVEATYRSECTLG